MTRWEKAEYEEGQIAFCEGKAFFSYKSLPWQHGWKDAAKYDQARKAFEKLRGGK